MAEHTESRIRIDAPPADVLDAIAELEAYPSWAADMKAVRVLSEDELGWPQEAEFRVESRVMRDTYVLAYTWDVDEDSTGEVSWNLVRSSGIEALDGSYRLAADGDGTEVTYRLNVELKVPLPALLRRTAEKAIVGTALKELKKHVEG